MFAAVLLLFLERLFDSLLLRFFESELKGSPAFLGFSFYRRANSFSKFTFCILESFSSFVTLPSKPPAPGL